jgi:vacuolar-type H+-ATPase subunit I/STV1
MASAVTTLSRRLRILLASCTPNELEKYLSDLDEFTGNLTEHDATLHAFEKELHSAHDALVADAAQIEIFVAVLHRLIHALSSTSIIMSWWDLCLRPALREPKHSVVTVRRARELVLAALHNPSTQYSKLVSKFRQQLMELYLLDALNEGSGEDILAWAERDQKDRAVIKSWKDNLEAILIKHGCEHPAVSVLACLTSFVPSYLIQRRTFWTRLTITFSPNQSVVYSF